MGLPIGQTYLRKMWQNGLRTTKSRYWTGHQSLDLNPIVDRTEKGCVDEENYKPDSLTTVSSAAYLKMLLEGEEHLPQI